MIRVLLRRKLNIGSYVNKFWMIDIGVVKLDQKISDARELTTKLGDEELDRCVSHLAPQIIWY